VKLLTLWAIPIAGTSEKYSKSIWECHLWNSEGAIKEF